MRFRQYDVVKLKKINRQFSNNELSFSRREPKEGDVATIVEVYEKPTLGYELECSDETGITTWLVSLSPDEVELELIREDA